MRVERRGLRAPGRPCRLPPCERRGYRNPAAASFRPGATQRARALVPARPGAARAAGRSHRPGRAREPGLRDALVRAPQLPVRALAPAPAAPAAPSRRRGVLRPLRLAHRRAPDAPRARRGGLARALVPRVPQPSERARPVLRAGRAPARPRPRRVPRAGADRLEPARPAARSARLGNPLRIARGAHRPRHRRRLPAQLQAGLPARGPPVRPRSLREGGRRRARRRAGAQGPRSPPPPPGARAARCPRPAPQGPGAGPGEGVAGPAPPVGPGARRRPARAHPRLGAAGGAARPRRDCQPLLAALHRGGAPDPQGRLQPSLRAGRNRRGGAGPGAPGCGPGASRALREPQEPR